MFYYDLICQADHERAMEIKEEAAALVKEELLHGGWLHNKKAYHPITLRSVKGSTADL